jgi:hypothetical protein
VPRCCLPTSGSRLIEDAEKSSFPFCFACGLFQCANAQGQPQNGCHIAFQFIGVQA